MSVASVLSLLFLLCSSDLAIGDSAVQIKIQGGAPTSEAHCIEDEKQTILKTVGQMLTDQEASGAFDDRAEYCSQLCLPTGTPGQLCTAIERNCNEQTDRRRLKGSRRRAQFSWFGLGDDNGNDNDNNDGGGGGTPPPDDDFFAMFSGGGFGSNLFGTEGNDGESGGDFGGSLFGTEVDDSGSDSSLFGTTTNPGDIDANTPAEVCTDEKTSFSASINSALADLISVECKKFLEMKFGYDCFQHTDQAADSGGFEFPPE